MASSTGQTLTASEPLNIPQQPVKTQDELPAPTPVEMTEMNLSTSGAQTAQPDLYATPTSSSDKPPPGPMRTDTATALDQSTHILPPPPTIHEHPQSRDRAISTAIGPSSDSPIVPSKDADSAGPTLMITLLLTSGARHPFKLDSKYLQKRNVEVQGNDPFSLSVYKLKELILREWRDEWEAKPASPTSIRLISFGKLLDDKAPLKDSRFNTDAPNVLHMTIKPQDFVEEEDAKGAKGSYASARENEGRSPGCRCSVM